jgi:hypothetical protein
VNSQANQNTKKLGQDKILKKMDCIASYFTDFHLVPCLSAHLNSFVSKRNQFNNEDIKRKYFFSKINGEPKVILLKSN